MRLPEIFTTAALAMLLAVPAFAARDGKTPQAHEQLWDCPKELAANLELLRQKCTKCHSLERIGIAISTGVAPVSGQQFDARAIHSYAGKALRKPSYGLSKAEMDKIETLLKFYLARQG